MFITTAATHAHKVGEYHTLHIHAQLVASTPIPPYCAKSLFLVVTKRCALYMVPVWEEIPGNVWVVTPTDGGLEEFEGDGLMVVKLGVLEEDLTKCSKVQWVTVHQRAIHIKEHCMQGVEGRQCACCCNRGGAFGLHGNGGWHSFSAQPPCGLSPLCRLGKAAVWTVYKHHGGACLCCVHVW